MLLERRTAAAPTREPTVAVRQVVPAFRLKAVRGWKREKRNTRRSLWGQGGCSVVWVAYLVDINLPISSAAADPSSMGIQKSLTILMASAVIAMPAKI